MRGPGRAGADRPARRPRAGGVLAAARAYAGRAVPASSCCSRWRSRSTRRPRRRSPPRRRRRWRRWASSGPTDPGASLLRAVPELLKDADPRRCCCDALGGLGEGRRAPTATEAVDHLLATLACHSVKRAGTCSDAPEAVPCWLARRGRSALALPARPPGAGAPDADRARTALRSCLIRPRPDSPRVVAILGPTASGKSALALALADRLGGEIVCCDSHAGLPGHGHRHRQAHARRAGARFRTTCWTWSMPDEPFHAARWAELARAAIAAIHARGRAADRSSVAPGLYFRALVRGLFEAPPSDPEMRARHEEEARALRGCRRCTPAWPPSIPRRPRASAPTICCASAGRWRSSSRPACPISRCSGASAPAPSPLSLFTVLLDPPLPDLRAGHRRPGRRHDGGRVPGRGARPAGRRLRGRPAAGGAGLPPARGAPGRRDRSRADDQRSRPRAVRTPPADLVPSEAAA